MALEFNSPLLPKVVSMAVFVFAIISFKPGSKMISDNPELVFYAITINLLLRGQVVVHHFLANFVFRHTEIVVE
jgi:hypothetical protein